MSAGVDDEWLKTAAAQDYLNSILQRGKRKQFGLLEHPSLPPQKAVSVIKYKVFVCGKASVGKSATIAKLAGTKVNKHVNETAGIETTSLYWPVRLITNGKVVFFYLQLWDVGDNAINKFDHILPACKEDVDCILFTFSLTDRTSFVEVPHYMTRMSDGTEKPPARIVIATKADQYIHSDISEREIQDLSETHEVPVLRINNLSQSFGDGYESIKDVALVLNKLCESLWIRDQQLSTSYGAMYHQQSMV
uniref:Ciliogenesis and planar polarity effector 2 n=1 Tax=Phallusia mammillata TaxID=59560 RepID=A0A6F9DAJ1_9ASCI|nr:REM2- and Rab-like small GTPase 1 [Phallusia mammillata]